MLRLRLASGFIAALVACTSDAGPGARTGGAGGTGGSSAEGGGGAGGSAGQAGAFAGSGGFVTCQGDRDDDVDQDGWTKAAGDCDDCDSSVSPNAVEVIAEARPDFPPPLAADEDCDGLVDEVETCPEADLAIDDEDPLSALRAIGLCKVSSGANDWGIVSADWVRPDGSPAPSDAAAFGLGHGLLAQLGASTPALSGGRMLALSSGSAREPGQPGFSSSGPGIDKGWTSSFPFGLPYTAPPCGVPVESGVPHDGIALDVEVRAPANVGGASFMFQFFSAEWPDGICTAFDDAFATLVGLPPRVAQNVAFDLQDNPISANFAAFEACGCTSGPPCAAGGKTFACPLGAGPLAGSGFGIESGAVRGSTGWLESVFVVHASAAFTVRFLIYDAEDGDVDSTVLVDGFAWKGAVFDPGFP